LKIESMQSALEQAKVQLQAFYTAQAAMKLAVAQRETAFDGFGKKITRVQNTLKASGSSDALDEKAHALVVQMRGRRKSVAPKAAGETSTSTTAVAEADVRSTSHQSYENRVVHLDQFLKLLENVPDYAPSESELTAQGLESWKGELQGVNTQVMHAHTVLGSARTERDQALYATRSGLVDLAMDCKSYLRAALGSDHPVVRSVGRLKFIRIG